MQPAQIQKIIGIDSAVRDLTINLTEEEWEQSKAVFLKAWPRYAAQMDAEKSNLSDPEAFHRLQTEIANTMRMHREPLFSRSSDKIISDPELFIPTPGGTLANIFYNMRGVMLERPCEMTMYGTASAWPEAEFPLEGRKPVKEAVAYPLDNELGRAESLVINVTNAKGKAYKRTFVNSGRFGAMMNDRVVHDKVHDKMMFSDDSLVWITGSSVCRMGNVLEEPSGKLMRYLINDRQGPIAYNLPTSYPKDPILGGILRASSQRLACRADFVFGNITELFAHHFGAAPEEEALATNKAALTMMFNRLRSEMSPTAEAVFTAGGHGAYYVTKKGVEHVPSPGLDSGKPFYPNCAGDTTIGTYMALRQVRDDLSPVDCLKVAMQMAKIKIHESSGRIPPERHASALGEALDRAGVLLRDSYYHDIVSGALRNQYVSARSNAQAFRVSSPVLLERASPARTLAL